MHGTVHPFPNKPSWRGVQLNKNTGTTSQFPLFSPNKGVSNQAKDLSPAIKPTRGKVSNIALVIHK